MTGSEHMTMVCVMMRDRADLVRTFGGSTRLWAAAGQHEVHQEWWLALSGEADVNFNLAFSRSADPAVLTQCCLQPLLDHGKPGMIMLSGAGLATAQLLADANWVNIGARPLMLLESLPSGKPSSTEVRKLAADELDLARHVIKETFGTDHGSAKIAVPDTAAERDDVTVWGLFAEDRLVASVAIVVEDGLAVIWSMATLPESQGRGYGRRLIEAALRGERENGATGSLLYSSVAGESLYRGLGYEVIEYFQMWSRPRWVLGLA
jgi:GNAT superfamily N-acetyltransferase